MSVERLTMIDGIGNDELVRCMGCGLEKAGENLENCGFCEEGWQKALKKLAAYEDTGLDPEDFKKAFNEESFLTMTAQMMGITPERLRELAKADRDGRCKIHMVKDGERVYSIFAYVNGLCPKKPNGKPFDTIAEYTVDDFTRNTVDREFGKTVFLTREAAEAALKGEQNGQ